MAEVQVNKADDLLREQWDPLPPRSLAGGPSGVTACGSCFHRSLPGSGMSCCSRDVRVADIGGMLGPTVARVLYHQEALRAIAAAFEDRRISFILLKGEVLSKVWYPQAAAQ